MKSSFRALALAFSFVSLFVPAAEAKAEPRKKGGGVPPLVEHVYAPTDLADLRAKMNRRVVVEGTITGAGESRKGTIRYLNFTKDYKQSISLVFFARTGGASFAKGNLAGYVGKKVRVGGLLSEYQGALQIKIESLEQIRVLP